MKNKELAEKLHNLIIRKFEKLKVHSSFINSIWSADLADVQLLNKFNKRIRFLLSVIDIYSKCVWVIPLKDKKGIIITNAFQKILDEWGRKPNKIWVGKGSKFYNIPMESRVEKKWYINVLTHNEEKFVVAERFIKTLKNKIYKYITSISNNMYIDKLDDIANR